MGSRLRWKETVKEVDTGQGIGQRHQAQRPQEAGKKGRP
jgi:hypothetical protein